MKKQTFPISGALDAVIKQVKINLTGGQLTKEKALKDLIKLAQSDRGQFQDDGRFNGVADRSCTVPITDDEYAKAVKYRSKYSLDTKKGFCLHALKHGAALWQAQHAAADEAAVEAAKKVDGPDANPGDPTPSS